MEKLTPEEKKVIVNKGTEAPFSGKYNEHFETGTYICRRCKTPLYESKSKFRSSCGWPSFDEEIKGAVKRQVDIDGKRIELICANCGAHLGHEFKGERLTPKNVRHCVNSVSLEFIPGKEKNTHTEEAIFGGGCFWCTESIFSELKGVIKVTPGYAGGKTENPTYEEVSSGKTGHAEVVKIEYSPNVITYQDLLNVLFTTHDPTTKNRQGADIGSQYRSVILTKSNNQDSLAKTFIHNLEKDKIFGNPIETEVRELTKFYPAENYHQDYYQKNPSSAYCQSVITPKLSKLREKYKKLMK